MHSRTGVIAKLSAGAVGAAMILGGPAWASSGWISSELHSLARTAPSGPNDVWDTHPENDPAPEWVDVSKLTIVGTIDPSTGDITDVPPHHPSVDGE